jgi:hypothetical protein
MSVSSQTYITIYPDVESQSIETIEITKIEINEVFTIVDLFYESNENESWICASRYFYIQPDNSNERKYLIMAKEIPICPEKFVINSFLNEIKFQLYFPRIDPLARKIDIIEKPETGFNFFGVSLNNEPPRPATDSCRYKAKSEFTAYFEDNITTLDPIEGIWILTSKRAHYAQNKFIEYLDDEYTIEVAILRHGDHFECYEMEGNPLEAKFLIISQGGRYMYKEYFKMICEEITSFVLIEEEYRFKLTFSLPENWAKYLLQGEFLPGDKVINELIWEKICPL